MTQAKAVSNYTNSILANMEATDDGYDEAMLLDPSGFVSEGAGENLFVVKTAWSTPPTCRPGALNGITRNTVCVHLPGDLGLEVVQKRITRDEVTFATKPSSPAPPQKSPHPRARPNPDRRGSRGPITEKINRPSSTSCNGRNPGKYAHWLTPVAA